jgi:signal peptidase
MNVLLAATFLTAAAYVVPALLGYQHYVITGGSMTGTYDKGSIVFEKAVAAHDLEVGDVITYQPPASTGVTWLVTHRIIKVGHDAKGRQVLRTKGDANPDADPWSFSLTSDHQTVVVASVPYAGWALIGLADRHTRMLLVGLPALLIALLSLGQVAAALRPGARAVRPAGLGGSLGVTGRT